MADYEVLRGKWIITEWRDKCVYKTTYIADEWVDGESAAAKMHTVGDIQWTSPKNKDRGPSIRHKNKRANG